MRLGFAILCLAVFTLLSQQARAESVRWMQPDYEPRDTWEWRVVEVEVSDTWLPLELLWQVGNEHGAVVEPLLSWTVEARTWRDGVVSEVSEPHVYVPEPGVLVGLVAGISCLAALRRFN